MAETKIVWDRDKKRYKLHITDAWVSMMNFSGEEDDYGRRVKIIKVKIEDPAVANELIEDGWRLNTPWKDKNNRVLYKPFEEDEEGNVIIPSTTVKINWDAKYPPQVILHTDENRRGERLNETTSMILDSVRLENINLVINPSYWQMDNGSSGTKGYLEVFHADLVNTDPFASMYVEDEEDEVPFE